MTVDVVRASLGPGSTIAEAYRGIRTALSYALRADAPRHAVLFTSADDGDGKSTTLARSSPRSSEPSASWA